MISDFALGWRLGQVNFELTFPCSSTSLSLLTPLSSDPAGTLCHSTLKPPRGSVKKPHCELNSFLPQPSTLKWVAPLTDSAFSPMYLQADWVAASLHGLDKQLVISSIMRAGAAANEQDGKDCP